MRIHAPHPKKGQNHGYMTTGLHRIKNHAAIGQQGGNFSAF